MTRRKSILALPAAAAALPAAASTPAIFELRYFQLRNNQDSQSQRTTDFLQQSYMPALARAGGKVQGAFGSLIAPNTPFLLTLVSYPSLASMEATLAKLASDKQYQAELEANGSKPTPAYVRIESTLLRAFPSMPEVEITAPKPGAPPRVFELRTYESNTPATLRRKIGMFESGGEIAIFRRTGLTPVFFGETIVGRNMPNLTYMLVYDNLAAREKNWAAFISDPEWLKLRAQPGLSDPEIVSNISNILLRPLLFSPIR